MLKRDFIMVQIEELGKVIAQIIFNRNANAARKNPELIQTVYSSLKLDQDFLMTTSPGSRTVTSNRKTNRKYSCGLKNCWNTCKHMTVRSRWKGSIC